MGTIVVRKRKSGEPAYLARIRIKKDGAVVYTENQTFDRRATAAAWIKKRETELAVPGAIERSNRAGVSVRDMIARYFLEYDAGKRMGRSKRHSLNALARSWLGDVLDSEINSQTIIEYANWRRSPDGGGVQGQTVANDLSHLSAVLSIARPAWGYDIDPMAMPDALRVLTKVSVINKSRERSRRPTLAELDDIFAYMKEKKRRGSSPMPLMVIALFALFSTRRVAEICRIKWADLNVKASTVIVRDMKNPGEKWGNDVECHLPDEAMQIIQAMPRVDERIFPFNARTVSSYWSKAVTMAGVVDLRFHDLRHDGISRLFELNWGIPQVARVSGHIDWNSLRRYTHLAGQGDKYQDWPWLAAGLASLKGD